MSLSGTHYCKYEGQVFYKEKKEVRKFAVSGRVMINAALFRENNLNYFFPSIDEKPLEDNDDSNSEDIPSGND
jgi:hypothetical protein